MILEALDMNGTPQAWKVGPYYVPTTYNFNTSPNPKNLFVFNSTKQNEVNFNRQISDVKCDLDITADPPQGTYPSQYNVYEGCYHNINFFGGWDCSKQACLP